MNRFLRQAGFLTSGLLLKWPILALLALTRHFHRINYIIVVYPGSDNNLDGYIPRRLSKSRIFPNIPTLAGFISNSPGGRGLIIMVPNTIKEFLTNKDHFCEKMIKNLIRINNLVGAKSIAIAGQLPSVFARKGYSLEKTFVQGKKGTVFCIMETIHHIMETHELDINNTRIAVVGVGYCGKLLLNFLEDEGYCAIGIDIFPHTEAIILKDNIYHVLSTVDMVVALTPSGDDFSPYIKYLREEAIIIDDTYPEIAKKPLDRPFYKAAVGIKGVRIIPHFPGYKPDWVPGCVVEAIVTAAIGDCSGISQKEFNTIAKDLGFFTHLSPGLLRSTR